MNCRPGDKALVVRSACPENLGKIVTCIAVREWPTGVYRVVWDIEETLLWVDPFGNLPAVAWHFAADENLIPLRPNDGEEIIDISALPLSVKQD